MLGLRRRHLVVDPEPFGPPAAGDAVDIWMWLEAAGARLVYRSTWLDPTGLTVITNTPRRTR